MSRVSALACLLAMLSLAPAPLAADRGAQADRELALDILRELVAINTAPSGGPGQTRRAAEAMAARLIAAGIPAADCTVLGLAPGGATRGMAYRVAEAEWPATYAYLLEREQPTETYIEARRTLHLADGRRVEALVFLSDIHHPQWAGRLSLERQAELISGAVGLSGRNEDYLKDLVEHLRAS